jgi:hypothetical protein
MTVQAHVNALAQEMEVLAEKGQGALAHYGVKGMKWGRRKASDSDSGGSKSGSSKPKAEIDEAAAAVIARRKHIGKEVVKAVVLAAGGVAIGSVAGPLAAAAAVSAVKGLDSALKDVGSVTTVSRGSDGTTTFNAPDSRPTSGWGKNQEQGAWNYNTRSQVLPNGMNVPVDSIRG